MSASLVALLTHPAVASAVLEGAKFIMAEIRLGKYDELPAEERQRLLDAADALDAERERLRPRGSAEPTRG